MLFSFLIVTAALLTGCTRQQEARNQPTGNTEQKSVRVEAENEDTFTTSEAEDDDIGTLEKDLNSVKLDEVTLD